MMVRRLDKKQILEILDEIDELAADSRGEYSNARGNDYACYTATKRIRELLKDVKDDLTTGDKGGECPHCGSTIDGHTCRGGGECDE